MRSRQAAACAGHPVRLAALAMLPMLGALAGASIDERARMGVTIWRSACRASGFAPASLAGFTLELLPSAVIGALLGGIAVLAFAFGVDGGARARESLAAHAGCALAMPVGLWLCAMALPLPIMLAVELLLGGAFAFAAARALFPRSRPADTQYPEPRT